jgi:hypothetical protein
MNVNLSLPLRWDKQLLDLMIKIMRSEVYGKALEKFWNDPVMLQHPSYVQHCHVTLQRWPIDAV